jgi:hypothetical protein
MTTAKDQGADCRKDCPNDVSGSNWDAQSHFDRSLQEVAVNGKCPNSTGFSLPAEGESRKYRA